MSTKDQISLTSSDSVALEDIDHDLDQEEDLDESTEHLDPRVHVELERLNEATEIINKYEVQLEEAKAAGRQAFCQMTQQLQTLALNLGKCIQKSRPYYEARVDLKKAQMELQQAALLFEKANASLRASKEIVKLTEEGLTRQGGKLDETWQEMLNYSTKKVLQCEQDLRVRQRDHWQASKVVAETDIKVKLLEKRFKSSITKSKPYYELYAQLNHFVEKEKLKVHQLEQSIALAKSDYAEGLSNLEGISEQIHLQRRVRDDQVQRDSGCGTISETASISGGSLDMTSIADIPMDGPSRSTHSSPSSSKSNTLDKNRKIMDALHDIIYQSNYEDEASDGLEKRRSRVASVGTGLGSQPNSGSQSSLVMPSSSNRHSVSSNAQSYPLLSALEKEVSRLHVECQTEPLSATEVPKRKLQTVLSVDSAVDSGSDTEGFEAPEDDMIHSLHLSGPPPTFTFRDYFF